MSFAIYAPINHPQETEDCYRRTPWMLMSGIGETRRQRCFDMTHHLLISGTDAQLLSLRKSVLSQAGFSVHTVTQFQNLAALPAEAPIELVILCHTLSDEQRCAVVDTLLVRWPNAKVIALTRLDKGGDDSASGFITVSGFDPRDLIAKCHQLLDTANLPSLIAH